MTMDDKDKRRENLRNKNKYKSKRRRSPVKQREYKRFNKMEKNRIYEKLDELETTSDPSV